MFNAFIEVVIPSKRLLNICLAMLCLSCFGLNAQTWTTRKGTIEFEATVVGFEAVEARKTHVAALLDPGEGKIAVLARVREFEFPNSLMETHFNENYMDSDTYPRMKFSGQWEKGVQSDRINLKGSLTIRDVTREVVVPAVLKKSEDQLRLSGSFELRPEEYGVRVPRIVRMKIAEIVRINFVFYLESASE